jgi:hypothetical protein
MRFEVVINVEGIMMGERSITANVDDECPDEARCEEMLLMKIARSCGA